MLLTKAQIAALRWLAAHKGCARLDQYGRIISAKGVLSPNSSSTFLRLMLSGHCAPHPLADHIGITATGLGAIR